MFESEKKALLIQIILIFIIYVLMEDGRYIFIYIYVKIESMQLIEQINNPSNR